MPSVSLLIMRCVQTREQQHAYWSVPDPNAPFLSPTHTRAAFYLATGFGNKPADEISAFKLESAAAEGGSIPAALAVAFRLLHGVDGVMPDCQNALEIYRVSLRFGVGCLDWFMGGRVCAPRSVDGTKRSTPHRLADRHTPPAHATERGQGGGGAVRGRGRHQPQAPRRRDRLAGGAPGEMGGRD